MDEGEPYSQPITIEVDSLIDGSMSYTSSAVRNGILCLLNLRNPLSFDNGTEIAFQGEHFEKFTLADRHHIFPIDFLKREKIGNARYVHRIPNFAFIPQSLNEKINTRVPSEYMDDLASNYPHFSDFENVMRSHLIPVDEDSGIWSNDYELFLRQRAQLMINEVKYRCGIVEKIEPEDRHPVVEKLESALRDFLDIQLQSEYGTDYWKQGIANIAGHVHTKVFKRIDAEVKKNPGISKGDFDDLRMRLDQLDVSDYPHIITKGRNWSRFGSAFRDKNDCKRNFDDFREYRNAVAHNKQIDSILELRGTAAILWIARCIDLDLTEFGIS
ncbi:MAG: hypothetical protein AAFR81_25635 [Chloroflexota bacterium]